MKTRKLKGGRCASCAWQRGGLPAFVGNTLRQTELLVKGPTALSKVVTQLGGPKVNAMASAASNLGKYFKGGYKATARDKYYLRKYKRGESIGFTMKASLKAKGLLPRTSKTMRGKRVLGAKYR